MNKKIILNSKQARQIAIVIYKDIFEYVQNHKEEYEEFLNNEKILDMQDTQKGA